MQNFGKNVLKMQHYWPGLHLLKHMTKCLKKGQIFMNGGGNL